MKRHLLISSIIFLNCSLVMAQVNNDQINPAIAVAPFSNGKGIEAKRSIDLAQKIEDVLINQKRITVLEDRMSQKVLDKLKGQREEIYLNSTKLANQGKLIGASYMLVGKVMSAGDNAYQFNLKIVDVSTGKSISSKTYKSVKHLISKIPLDKKTNEKIVKYVDWAAVLEELTGKVERDVKKFINSSFPMTYKIVQPHKEDEKNIEELMIEGGAMNGLKNKLNLNIVHETVINSQGKILRRKEIIGQVQVSRVEGEVSIVQVKSGGDKLKELLENKQNKVYLSTSR